MDVQAAMDKLTEATSDPSITSDQFGELVNRIRILRHLQEN